jgi:hypothetical protein
LVKALTAKQLAALARSGRVTLAVSGPAGARVSVRFTTMLGGRRTTVGNARGVLKPGGAPNALAVRLSPAARSRLARAGRLRLRIVVQLSGAKTVRATSVTLQVPTKTRGTR